MITLNQRGLPQHPAVLAQLEARHKSLQTRLADAITAFAGSMQFVYIHAVVFAVWMIFLEKDPWPKLTLVVSLEAIFLSTFVMIGQNRAAAFQQAKANHDFVEQEQELKTKHHADPRDRGPDQGDPPTRARRSHDQSGRERPTMTDMLSPVQTRS
jgi:hypothetical protein